MLEHLLHLARQNQQAQRLYAHLLTHCDGLFSMEEIRAFAADCGLPLKEAYVALLSAACGLEPDTIPHHRHLTDRYLAPALSFSDSAAYRCNPYYRQIRFPEITKGSWQMTHLSYQPAQLFPSGDPLILPDGREIQLLSCFEDHFSYPAVLEEGREWMTITPNEIETMASPIEKAWGKAAVFGLGLGYFPFMISEKDDIASVTIIERDPQIIDLFQDHLLPQFPHREKIRLIQADAFDYMSGPMEKEHYDFAFIDLWHDVSDGLPLYLKCRRLEKPGPCYHYWIECSLLLFLKGLLLEDWQAGRTYPGLTADTLASQERLKAWAPVLSPEDFLP